MMRATLYFLCVALLLATTTFNSTAVAQQAAATTANPINVKGLKDRVTIRRDERGIPYIDAKNDEDLYFAQGYATAQDRLWQMDLFRRNARGELSEVLPKVPGSPALDQDKLHRILGFGQVVEAEVQQASPKSRTVLEA